MARKRNAKERTTEWNREQRKKVGEERNGKKKKENERKGTERNRK